MRFEPLSIAVGVLLFAVACSGAQKSETSGGSVDDCADVAAHLVQLAVVDNEADATPADMTGAESEFVRQCRGAPWSRARRDCLLAASDQEQTLRCSE